MNKYFKGYITRENAVKVMCRETCHPGVFCPDTYCVEMWNKFKDIPNEDVRPVRQGKWIEANTHTYGIYECTACKAWTYIPNEPRDYNFCPRCGADMWEVKRMSGKNDIKVVTDLKPKDTRACEICGGLTDRIDMHICSHCRHALALIIRDWEESDETDK